MRKYLFAFAGLIASLGIASAQSPSQGSQFATDRTSQAPKQQISEGIVAVQAAQPAPAQPALAVAAPVMVQGPGCTACTDGPRASKGFVHKFLIGEGCAAPLGCSNLASERTFLFGSCRQFFNAGDQCGSHSDRFGGCAQTGYPGNGGCKSCGGGGSEKHPCQGVTSYLNR